MTQPGKSSIKRKVMMAIMLASLTVLLVTVAAFMVYDLVTFRQTMVRNLGTQARLIAENTTAALAFRNEKDAVNVLASLRAEPHIIAAAIYDADGRIFSKYPAQIQEAALPRKPQNISYQFGESQLTLFEPIIQSGMQLGTLYLQSDLTALSQRIHLYAVISLLIMLGSLLVAFWLSNMLQSRISNPIVALAKIARKISGQKDYSARATKTSNDELGDLTEAFNSMLDQVQTSHSALRKSEEQLRIVADHASVYLCQFDRDCRFRFVNRAYAERYGLPMPQLIGKRLSEVLGTRAFELIRPHIDEAFTGKKVEFEKEISYDTLGVRWVHAVFMPERNLEGQVVGIVAVINDVSLRKHEQQELERARDEALNAARAKDDFLAALSHELRTPLNPVLLVASDAVNNPQLPAETRADFEMIRRNVELEARLIDDLLDLTRITRGKLLLDQHLLDAHEALREAIATVRVDAEKKQITLATELCAGEHIIFGDSVRLQQVFWNVLKNAVKFTHPGGKITVKTYAHADALFIEIMDTGIGINAEELKRVFTAFAQGDHAEGGSHRFGGLGLGLAISQKLVELHSGLIQASSEGRDKGATFTIQLPLSEETNQQERTQVPILPQNSQMPAHGKRILLVEDHEPTRTALAHLLARRHFEVVTAASVTEARDAAGKNKIDLLISDIGLPDGNGYDLMTEMRKLYGLNGIALTGYGMEEDVAHSKKAGFVAHLTKPVRIQSLDGALAAALIQPKQPTMTD